MEKTISNAKQKQRIKYFDLLKGMAIFLVVMGHALTMGIREIDSAFLFKIIKEVHMPLFFFISGYMTYKISFKRPDLGKRFKQLMIPFFIMSALWIWYFPHSGLQSPLNSTFEGLYTDGWKNGYWFTLCLFEIFLLYYPISYILNRISKASLQILFTLIFYVGLILVNIFIPTQLNGILGFDLLTCFFPVFMIGIFANKYKEEYQYITSGNYWFIIGLILFAFAWYYMAYFWEFPQIPSWFKSIATPIEHLGLVIVAVTLIRPWSEKEYADNSKPSHIARYFNYLGQESLSIYLLHYFFLFPLTVLQAPLRELGLNFVPLLLISMVVAFCVIAVTLFINYLIQCNKTLSFLLIGKS